jgi:hypothetical protein
MAKIKTLKQWDKSGIELTEFLKPCDQVDEDLYMHMGEIVAPQYCSREFLQVGEAGRKEDGVYFYTTFSQVDGKYFYLGVLPELMQE